MKHIKLIICSGWLRISYLRRSLLVLPFLMATVAPATATDLDAYPKYFSFQPRERLPMLSLPQSWLALPPMTVTLRDDSSMTRAQYGKGDYNSSAVVVEYMPAGTGFYGAMNRETYLGYQPFQRADYRILKTVHDSELEFSDQQADYTMNLSDLTGPGHISFRMRKAVLNTPVSLFGRSSEFKLETGLLDLKRSHIDSDVDGRAEMPFLKMENDLHAGPSVLSLRVENRFWSHDSSGARTTLAELKGTLGGLSAGLGFLDRTPYLRMNFHGEKYGLSWDTGLEPLFPALDLGPLTNPNASLLENVHAAVAFEGQHGPFSLSAALRADYGLADAWATFYSVNSMSYVYQKAVTPFSAHASLQTAFATRYATLELNGKAFITQSYSDLDYDPEIYSLSALIDLPLTLFDGNLQAHLRPDVAFVGSFSPGNTYFSPVFLKYLQIYEAGNSIQKDVFLGFTGRARIGSLEIEYDMRNVLARPVQPALNAAVYNRLFMLNINWCWMN